MRKTESIPTDVFYGKDDYGNGGCFGFSPNFLSTAGPQNPRGILNCVFIPFSSLYHVPRFFATVFTKN